MGESRGDALVVEHNGDVYSCDHFVYPEHMLGNIKTTTLADIYSSQKRRDFGLAKRRQLIVSPEREGARIADWSVTAKGYGEFLTNIFDEWVKGDIGHTFM